MNELTKITDVSQKYALTARTLRYYEDIGLLTSTRADGYAHRMYDETAISRIKQIIILRKLNISIKDIKHIFDAPNTDAVLDVLGKKADNIDDEVALLHELKSIILDFISQIKESDFHNANAIKLLYDKAKEVEAQITNAGEQQAEIDLSTLVVRYFNDEPKGGFTGRYNITDSGELVIASHGYDDADYIGLQTTNTFALPLQIDVVATSIANPVSHDTDGAETPNVSTALEATGSVDVKRNCYTGEVWLHYGKGGLAINHDTDGQMYIHVNDIFTGQHTSFPMEKIALDGCKISWVLDYGESNVYVNGEHFHNFTWPSATSFADKAAHKAPAGVCAGNCNTVVVKSMTVTETKATVPQLTRLIEVTEKFESTRLTPPIAINTYRQTINATRFIGKKYASGGEAWGNWSDDWDWDEPHSLFSRMGIDATAIYKDGNPQDGCALIGLMYHNDNIRKQDEPYHFEYWLGFFMPANTPVPEGYDYTDFPAQDVGVCWLYGKEDDVMAREPLAFEKLKAEDFNPMDDWWFERYVPYRETADKNGYKIMDICFFVENEKGQPHDTNCRNQL